MKGEPGETTTTGDLFMWGPASPRQRSAMAFFVCLFVCLLAGRNLNLKARNSEMQLRLCHRGPKAAGRTHMTGTQAINAEFKDACHACL